MPVSQALAAAGYPFTITDAAGREVTVERPLERVVPLNRQTSECIVSIGARDKIVATGDATVRNNPYLGLGNLPEMAGTGYESAEAILALKPDAVFAYSARSPYIDDQLEGSGVKVIRLDNNRPLSEDRELLLLGKLLDREEEARSLLSWKRGLRMMALEKAGSVGVNGRKTVAAFLLSPIVANGSLRLYPAYGSDGGPGPGEGFAAILAGGRDAFPSVTANPGSAAATVTINDEFLLQANPQAVTFHGSVYGGYDGPGPEEIQSHLDNIRQLPGFRLTDAALKRKMFFFHTDMLGGNKKEIGILQLIKYLYPHVMTGTEPLDFVRGYFESRLNAPFRGLWFYADGGS
jgi:iron complex transport system substrate-binding protein